MITELVDIVFTKVYDKGVIGCITHKKDLMITFSTDNKNIHDIFLTQKQGRELLKELRKCIILNIEASK